MSTLERLRARGLRLRLDGDGKVRAGPPDKIDAEAAAEIRANREEIAGGLRIERRRARCEEMLAEEQAEGGHRKVFMVVSDERHVPEIEVTVLRDGVFTEERIPREKWDPWKLLETLTLPVQ